MQICNSYKQKLIPNPQFLIPVWIFFCFFGGSGYLYASSSGEIVRKQVIPSKFFDLRVTKIQIKYTPKDGKEITKDMGTGFFLTTGDNSIYLVSAGHLFKDSLKILLDYNGVLVTYGRAMEADTAGQQKFYFEKDLVDSLKKGLLVFNEDKNMDIGILSIQEGNQKKEPLGMEKPEPTPASQEKPTVSPYTIVAVNVKADDGLIYDNIEPAEEVYFFGYPQLPSLGTEDQDHFLRPIWRRGIVSKLLEGKKITIEGFVSGGSSGSPVFVRRESIIPNGVSISFKLIGLVTQYFPVVMKQNTQLQVENAGLALVESYDNILDTLKQFETSKPEKKDNR